VHLELEIYRQAQSMQAGRLTSDHSRSCLLTADVQRVLSDRIEFGDRYIHTKKNIVNHHMAKVYTAHSK
jgi:hypothetical protein